MKYQALNNRVLIKPEPKPKEVKSGGGIILSDQVAAMLKPVQGKIVSAGDKCDTVKVGDKVVYNPSLCGALVIEDEEYHATLEEHIEFIVTD